MADIKEFSRKYFEFLNTELKGLNLTAIKDFNDFYNKQILDSICPIEQSKDFIDLITKAGLVIDIGFGGGFPILPLAYCLPDVKFLGVESKRKKVDAVTGLCKHLGLKNVKLVHQRFEEVLIDKSCVVVSKAVSTIENILCNLEYSVNTHIFFYKGPNLFALEEKGLNNVAESWEQISHTPIEVPLTEARNLIGFRNKNVPRGTNSNAKLTKLSLLM